MDNSKALLKVIFSLIAIVVAGYFIYRYATTPSTGSSPEVTTLICRACRHEFTVKTEDMDEKINENPLKNGMIKCPNCKEFAGTVAIRCLHCKKFYLDGDAGERGLCPHCGKSSRNIPPDQPKSGHE